MNRPDRERWRALWRTAGAAEVAAGSYERLTNAYSEPHRYYHNQQHIADCLAEFDQARHLVRQPVAMELALWFHDAVYDTKAADNEEQSALLAKRCLADAGMTTGFVETVDKLVMVTKNHDAGEDSDAAVMVDVDLSIFGQGEKRFCEYDEQIRQEYA